jgi:uncharacterized membrane protein (TIGR02234 family)
VTSSLLGRGGTLAVLLLGAGIGFVASAQPWWQATGSGASVTFSGSDVTGGLCQALAAVTLAGVLLILVLKVRGRRVLAVLVGVTGLGMVVTGGRVSTPDADSVRSRVRQISLTDQFALSATWWPWVYLVAGALVVLGAVLLWRGAPRWASRATRFDRSAAEAGPAADLDATLADDPARVWKDLDAGLDPTALADPDVRPEEQRATMDPTHDHRRE